MRRSAHAGMTLIEVTAALALSGAVIVAAAMLLDQANDAVARMGESGALQTRVAVGARYVRELFYDARTPSDSAEDFRGDERHVELTTRCPMPGGWLAACRATLALDSTRDSTIVRLDAGDLIALPLRTLAGAAAFRYVDPLAPDRWTREWRARATLPMAVAIIRATDTIVFPVGGVHE